MTLLSLKITDIILTEIIIHSEDVSVKAVLLFVITMAHLWYVSNIKSHQMLIRLANIRAAERTLAQRGTVGVD